MPMESEEQRGDCAMSDDERKVYVEVDGVIYRGRRSVNQSGSRVWIDGKEVGVEVDNNGDPLAAPLPVAHAAQVSWWIRLWRWTLPDRSKP